MTFITRKTLLLFVAVLVGSVSLFGVGSGIPSDRKEARERAEELKSALKTRFATISELQDASNDHREALSRAFELLDRELNLARALGGSGLAEAQSNWNTLSIQMPKARLANVQIVRVTTRILIEARNERNEIRELRSLLKDPNDRKYLSALDEALRLLIATHQEYEKMNERLNAGFSLYETLYERTDKFLAEERSGKFRSKREASQVFTLQTNELVQPILDFRRELEAIRNAAANLGARAYNAFQKAKSLRPAAV